MIRARFGVFELDEMLGGGLVKGDSVLLAGSAGSGKTTLGMQFLVSGIEKWGENGVYVTFEELPSQLYRDSANFGWDLKRYEKEGKLKVVCTSPNLLLDPDVADALLGRAIKETNATRIVFDSLSHLAAIVDEKTLRVQAYSLLMMLKRYKMTSVMLWEISQLIGSTFSITDMGLSFLLDGIILLRPVEIEGSVRRTVTVLKVRGSRHDDSLRSYDITDGGFSVGSRLSEYSGLLSGAPTRVVNNLSKLKEWLVAQPTQVGSARYQQLCTTVLALSGVRYAAVRDALGDLVAGGQRSGVPNIETAEDRAATDLRVTLMSGLFGASPRAFGTPHVLTVGYDKITMVSYPLGDGAILLVSLDVGSPETTIDTIAKIGKQISG